MIFALLCSQEKRYLIFNDLQNDLEKPQANPQLIRDDKVRQYWVNYLNSQRTGEDLRHYLSALGHRFKGKKLTASKKKT